MVLLLSSGSGSFRKSSSSGFLWFSRMPLSFCYLSDQEQLVTTLLEKQNKKYALDEQK